MTPAMTPTERIANLELLVGMLIGELEEHISPESLIWALLREPYPHQ